MGETEAGLRAAGKETELLEVSFLESNSGVQLCSVTSSLLIGPRAEYLYSSVVLFLNVGMEGSFSFK